MAKVLLAAILSILSSLSEEIVPQKYERPCNYTFFCDPKYLYALGKSKAFKDSKTIVDLVMKDDFNNFQAAFDKELFAEGVLQDPSKVREVVSKYFDMPGQELVQILPEDWQEDPFGTNITDPNLKSFALHLNLVWKNLTRMASKEGFKGNRTSFLPMPYETIVPGGRFLEIYYWDSYWTMQGLLVSKMYTTVKRMIQNMLHYVDVYGFVPNGGRAYYLGRSQPPFLTIMMDAYLQATGDEEFVKSSLKLLDKEYHFWLNNRQIKMDSNHNLFQYRTKVGYERPESFREDNETAQMAIERMGRRKEEVYVDLSSAAESGWDFSSRWLAYSGPHSRRLYSIRTTKIVPVCLNAILCRVAGHLRDFHEKLGYASQAQFYDDEFKRIRDGIDNLLWDAESNSWYDYDLDEGAFHYKMYPTNFFPLWAKCHTKSEEQISSMLKHLNLSGYMDYEGGFSTSTVYTTQQWDFPNAWAPLQDTMIEGLAAQGPAGEQMAMSLMKKWLQNNYQTYLSTGNMYEKYSATRFGYPGEGGEYDVQVGFGWSNGVALKYLVKYGRNLTLDEDGVVR